MRCTIQEKNSKKFPAGVQPAGNFFFLSERPSQHHEQAKAGRTQHTQHQGVEKIDAETCPQKLPHRSEDGQKGQSDTGPPQETEKAAQGPAEESQGHCDTQRAD